MKQYVFLFLNFPDSLTYRDVVDDDGSVIGQRPNPEPYHYSDQDVLYIDGNPTGETRPLLMGGAGRV